MRRGRRHAASAALLVRVGDEYPVQGNRIEDGDAGVSYDGAGEESEARFEEEWSADGCMTTKCMSNVLFCIA